MSEEKKIVNNYHKDLMELYFKIDQAPTAFAVKEFGTIIDVSFEEKCNVRLPVREGITVIKVKLVEVKND